MSDLGKLLKCRLVPVEVFGDDECDSCEAPVGWGLMDAVVGYSDCNSANGMIFRFDNNTVRREIDPDGDTTITVYVPESEIPKLAKRWGDHYVGRQYDPQEAAQIIQEIAEAGA